MFINKNKIIKQFIFLCCSKYQLSSTQQTKINNVLQNSYQNIIDEWYENFYNDIFVSRYGYSKNKVHKFPYSESIIDKILIEILGENLKSKFSDYGVCLTHDIDHLNSNFKLFLKNFISSREFHFGYENYLISLEKLLKFNAELSKKKLGSSSLFIACPTYPKNPIYWPINWLINPSYNCEHYLFEELLKLIKSYNPVVGLHGSFFSLDKNLLNKEKLILSKKLNQNIFFLRQHWLNLPSTNSLQQIHCSKFIMDSTLGWNGSCGFRGGMARPFPILLDNDKILWELPMVLMDGALFLKNKINEKDILKISLDLLSYVKKFKGMVSINWHERSASKKYYNWFIVYKKLLKRIKSDGFKFYNMNQVYQKYAK